MEAAEMLPSEMSALEMHGTGTALGDPIEIGAVCAVLKVGQQQQRSLALPLKTPEICNTIAMIILHSFYRPSNCQNCAFSSASIITQMKDLNEFPLSNLEISPFVKHRSANRHSTQGEVELSAAKSSIGAYRSRRWITGSLPCSSEIQNADAAALHPPALSQSPLGTLARVCKGSKAGATQTGWPRPLPRTIHVRRQLIPPSRSATDEVCSNSCRKRCLLRMSDVLSTLSILLPSTLEGSKVLKVHKRVDTILASSIILHCQCKLQDGATFLVARCRGL